MDQFVIPSEVMWDGSSEGFAGSSPMAAAQSNGDYRAYFVKHVPSLQVTSEATGEAKGKCPFHEDTTPSLSVNVRTGLFVCHACGAKGDVFKFHMRKHSVGYAQADKEVKAEVAASRIDASDANAGDAHKKRVHYEYTDASGNVLYRVVRYYDTEGNKRFAQERPNGSGGWIKNLDGVTLVPYKLPEVSGSATVFVVEGEKDVETLRSMGLVATCNSGGAMKWSDSHSQYLKGKDVVILPDNDDPGRGHAHRVAASVQGLAGSVKVVDLPGVPTKGDITDWMAMGNSKKTLLALVAAAPVWTGGPEAKATTWRVISGGDLLERKIHVEPVIAGLLARKETLLLCGTSGIGKSLLTLDVGLALGHPTDKTLWGRFGIPRPVKTIFFQAENADAAVQARLKRMCGTDPVLAGIAKTMLMFPEIEGSSRIGGKLLDESFQQMMIEMTLQAEASLIVIDPLISFLGVEENNNSDARKSLDCLNGVLDKTNASALIIHHHGKQGKGSHQGGRGAQAISDYAANILVVEPRERGSFNGFKLKAEHQKARNFEISTAEFFLDRSPDLRYRPAKDNEDAQAKAKVGEVVSVLAELGGKVNKQGELKDALSKSFGCSPSEAQRRIVEAVASKAIEEFSTGGRSKGYRIPDEGSVSPLGNAA